MRFFTSIAFAGALAGLVLASGARAGSDPDRDPAAVAERCIARIHTIGEAAVTHIVMTTARTVSAIEELLAAGDVEGAQAAARHGAARARRLGRRGIGGIHETAESCIRVIRRLGGDRELVHGVIQAARTTSARIEAAVEECLRRIREALEAAG